VTTAVLGTTTPADPTAAKAPAAAATTGPQLTRTSEEFLADADLWRSVKAAPRRTPAALALAAVAHHAETARETARWLRETYPTVPPDRLARVAGQTAKGRVRVMVAVGAMPLGGLISLPAIRWAHARMVLDIAAIHYLEPSDAERAAEILTLLRIYPDHAISRQAVEAIVEAHDGTPRLTAPPIPLRVGLRQVARRLLPGATLIVDGLSAITATEDLYMRAIRFYQRRHRL
jgi:hypothetical protein